MNEYCLNQTFSRNDPHFRGSHIIFEANILQTLTLYHNYGENTKIPFLKPLK